MESSTLFFNPAKALCMHNRLKKRTVFILFFLLIIGLKVFAQQEQIQQYRDLLLKEKQDTVKIEIMGNLANVLGQNSDTTEALQLLNDALALCEKNKYYYGFGHIYTIMGIYYDDISDYEKSEYYHKLGYENFSKGKDEKSRAGLGTVLESLASIETRKGNFVKAINLHLQALDIWQAISLPEKDVAIAAIYGNIANNYLKLDQYDKVINYDKKALEIRLRSNRVDIELGTLYIYLADDFLKNNQVDSAEKYILTAKSLADTLNIPRLTMKYNIYAAKIFFKKQDYRKSLEYSLTGIKYAKQENSVLNEMIANNHAAHSYEALHQLPQAIPHLEAELELARKYNISNQITSTLFDLSNMEYKLHHDGMAYTYLKEYITLNDSIQKNQDKIKLNEIDTKYQTAQKEKQILLLEKNQQQKNLIIYGLITGLIITIVIGFLVYRNFAIRKKIAETEIIRFEQERQLIATNSLLQGQEAERSRMAKDLHDGLGGMLSGIKLNLSSMKGNMIIQETDAQLFTKSISQLDNAIAEMRRVAHNMMPEALLKFGLGEAIQDYCDGINESNTVKMKYTQLGFQEPLEKSAEIILYRIIQELSNNAIKHAMAKNIFIQLTRHERGISLTVEDDGKGFDTTQLQKIKGAGLQNVQSRVDYLKGTCEIQSSAGTGTSVNIEIPV